MINGSKRVPSTVVLPEGWILAGYPTDTVKDIESSIATFNDSYTHIFSYDNAAGTYENYTKGSGGALNQTEPYRGYWINSSGGQWVVSW